MQDIVFPVDGVGFEDDLIGNGFEERGRIFRPDAFLGIVVDRVDGRSEFGFQFPRFLAVSFRDEDSPLANRPDLRLSFFENLLGRSRISFATTILVIDPVGIAKVLCRQSFRVDDPQFLKKIATFSR